MKQQSNDDNKVAKRVEAADNLVNIESDAKLSIKKYKRLFLKEVSFYNF